MEFGILLKHHRKIESLHRRVIAHKGDYNALLKNHVITWNIKLYFVTCVDIVNLKCCRKSAFLKRFKNVSC